MSEDEIARIRATAQESQRAHAAGAASHAERQRRMDKDMTFREYAVAAAKTARFASETAVTYNALKLCGEAGEIADKLGKGLMSGDFRIDGDGPEYISPELRNGVLGEAGDLLWHLTAILGSMGLTLDDVAEFNVNKLRSRSVRDVILGDGDER